jgi:hypothetical protein
MIHVSETELRYCLVQEVLPLHNVCSSALLHSLPFSSGDGLRASSVKRHQSDVVPS